MKPANQLTLEEVIAYQKEFDRRKEIGDAYMSDDDRWQAVRFTMNILHEMAERQNKSVLKCYDEIQSVNGFEDYILRNYDIMHTQDLGSTVYDIEQYIKNKKQQYD